MTPDIKKLYIFHLYSSVALSVLTNYLFMDKLFLRMGMNMSQLGIVKASPYLIPMAVNVLVTPIILRHGWERQAASIAYLLRVMIPFLLLLMPYIAHNTTEITVGCTIILLVSMIFPFVANTCIWTLCKAHIPPEQLGRHMSRIAIAWELPFTTLAIVWGWFLDLHSNGSDIQFYLAFAIVMVITTVFQIPASRVIWRMEPVPKRDDAELNIGIKTALLPFQDARFRNYLTVSFRLAMLSGMVVTFMFPFFLQAHKLTLAKLSIIGTLGSYLGFGMILFWGKISDKLGGKRVLRIGAFGIGIVILCLNLPLPGIYLALLYGLLTWNMMWGLFGSAFYNGAQCMTLSLSDPKHSNVYIAASEFINGCGLFTGALCGGFLLEGLKYVLQSEKSFNHYTVYYFFCGVGFLVMSYVARRIQSPPRPLIDTPILPLAEPAIGNEIINKV